jgi:hypothetical protein
LQQAERIRVHLDVINSDLRIKFPGTFLVTDSCFVLFDPFGSTGTVRILDKKTGNMFFSFVDIGRGPNEFVTPMCGYLINDSLTIFDLNAAKRITCSIDSLCKKNGSFTPKSLPRNDIVNLAMLKDNQYIVGIYMDKTPFCIIQNDTAEYEFGKYPVEADVTNAFDVFQGTILYNMDRNIICYATFDTPYLSLYEHKDDNYIMSWEKQFAKPQYSISNHQLKWNDNHPAGIHEFTFTRDYIACLVKEMDLKKSIGRTEDKMARAIYLYDYDGNLKKILDLDFPSIRITSTPTSNTLYLISLDEEYSLTKFVLQ